LKDLIRGLGANKTENAIVTISKAAPVISNITSNFDETLNIMDNGTRHMKRNEKDDLLTLVNALTRLDLWTSVPGRQLSKENKVSRTPFEFDKDMFKLTISKTVKRLKMGIPITDLEQDDDDEAS
jgi:hypothetical protein